MLSRITEFTRRPFVRNVFIVATGTAGAQAIVMAFAPIITRIYGPEAFGLLGTFLALVAVFTPIASLAYPIAIVLPKEDNDAKGIAWLSFYISLVVAPLVALVLLAGSDSLLALLGAQAIAAFVLLIPLNILFESWLQIAQQWLIRKKMFMTTAKVGVAQALLVNSAKAGIGWFSPLAAVLIVLSTFGSALHVVMLFLGTRSADESKTSIQKIKARTPLIELARRHYDFPLYRAPQMFINALSQNLPVLMLAAFFGPVSAGFYVLSGRLLAIPSQLMGKSVGDVFYPRITEAARNKENLTRLILKATLSLAAIGFLPYAIVVAFGPWLFGFVFGIEWVTAGEYARWLALSTFFMFLNNPSIRALPVLSAQGFHLMFTIFSVLIRVIVLATGYYVFNSDLIAVALTGASGALMNICLIVIVHLRSQTFDLNNYN